MLSATNSCKKIVQFLGDLKQCIVVKNHIQASKGKMCEHEFESILFV